MNPPNNNPHILLQNLQEEADVLEEGDFHGEHDDYCDICREARVLAGAMRAEAQELEMPLFQLFMDSRELADGY